MALSFIVDERFGLKVETLAPIWTSLSPCMRGTCFTRQNFPFSSPPSVLWGKVCRKLQNICIQKKKKTQKEWGVAPTLSWCGVVTRPRGRLMTHCCRCRSCRVAEETGWCGGKSYTTNRTVSWLKLVQIWEKGGGWLVLYLWECDLHIDAVCRGDDHWRRHFLFGIAFILLGEAEKESHAWDVASNPGKG